MYWRIHFLEANEIDTAGTVYALIKGLLIQLPSTRVISVWILSAVVWFFSMKKKFTIISQMMFPIESLPSAIVDVIITLSFPFTIKRLLFFLMLASYHKCFTFLWSTDCCDKSYCFSRKLSRLNSSHCGESSRMVS